MTRKYELLVDSTIEAQAKKGTIAYKSAKHDYGLAGDDTRITGVEHISLSLKEDGDYPFFTHPLHLLKEIKE
jgi:hypothetical protein